MGAITIVLPPAHTDWIDLSAFEAEIGADPDDSDVLRALVAQAQSRIQSMIGHPILRGQYLEKRSGSCSASREVTLSVRPLASLDAVTYRGIAQTLSDFSVGSRSGGLVQAVGGFSRFWRDEDPIAWGFTTTAGYFVPDDDLKASISVNAADSSYNSAANAFPPLLRPGDPFEASGWEGAELANNGPRVVVTATTSKITTSSTLVTASAANRELTFCDLPGGLAEAVKLLAQSKAASRTRDPGLIEESIAGATTLRWATGSSGSSSGSIEPSIRDLIQPYQDL